MWGCGYENVSVACIYGVWLCIGWIGTRCSYGGVAMRGVVMGCGWVWGVMIGVIMRCGHEIGGCGYDRCNGVWP